MYEPGLAFSFFSINLCLVTVSMVWFLLQRSYGLHNTPTYQIYDFQVGLHVGANSTKLFSQTRLPLVVVLKQATGGKLIRENNLATAQEGTEAIS